MLIKVPLPTVKIQAVSVAVQVCVEGLSACVGSQAGLERLVSAAGNICLVEVNLSYLTSSFQSGIIQVTACSDAAVIQTVISIRTAAVMLALSGAAAQASVVILSVFGATQTAIVQDPLCRPAQAAVVEVTGPPTPKAEVVQVKVQQVALSARKSNKAAFCVPSTQVVVVACWRVWRRAQKGGILCLWASRNQVIILLGADDVVDVCRSRTGVCLTYFGFLLVPPPVSNIEINTQSNNVQKLI